MKEKISIIILIIIFLLFLCMSIIFPNINISKNKQNNQASENPFYIKQQVYYSGITPKSTSFYESDFNLSISQYTDIAIYLARTSNELTDSNTIQSLYLDNISYNKKPVIGTPTLYYQNPTKFATDTVYSDYLIKDHFKYNILNFENTENYNYYSTPNFFTDCSIPITLKYLNSDIIKNYKLPNSETLEFDGKILKTSNIKLSDLDSTISFRINIVTNDNKLYKFDIDIDIPLSDSNKTIFDENIYIKK